MNKDTREIIETLSVILAKMVNKDDLDRLGTELRFEMNEGFASGRTEMRAIHEEVRLIHTQLDAIEAELRDHRGYAKEIDHLLQRVAEIEKHLGMTNKIAA